MTKEKSDLNQKSEQLEIMFCTFKEIKKCGHYEQCTAPVDKNKMDEANGNNNYCLPHQKFVDAINKERRQEANKELKENINKYIKNKIDDQRDEDCKTDFLLFLNKLENGNFDGNK